MIYSYPAVFFPDSSGYMAVFPDLDDLSVSGSDEPSCLAACKEALQAYLFSCKLNGLPVPKATPADKVDPGRIIEKLSLPFIEGTQTVEEVNIDV